MRFGFSVAERVARLLVNQSAECLGRPEGVETTAKSMEIRASGELAMKGDVDGDLQGVL